MSCCFLNFNTNLLKKLILIADELINKIQSDIEIAKQSLDEPNMAKYKEDAFIKT